MGDMQTTFVMIKPDGVQRGLVADIIGRFETKGLRMVGLRQTHPIAGAGRDPLRGPQGEALLRWTHRVHHIRACRSNGMDRR